MTAIAILPENLGTRSTGYRAVAGNVQSVGRTPGEALDAITGQLDETAKGTLVVVQHQHPDQFFTAPQQQRLQELMARWRATRDAQAPWSAEEQAELEALVQAELRAAAARAAALVRELAP